MQKITQSKYAADSKCATQNIDIKVKCSFETDVKISVFFFFRAFVRILCVCCPRKIRRKYQPTMRSKASQV